MMNALHLEIEVFVNRIVELIDDPYYDVIEVCPIPTVDELNTNIWGEGFYATIISKEEFDKIWNTGILHWKFDCYLHLNL